MKRKGMHIFLYLLYRDNSSHEWIVLFLFSDYISNLDRSVSVQFLELIVQKALKLHSARALTRRNFTNRGDRPLFFIRVVCLKIYFRPKWLSTTFIFRCWKNIMSENTFCKCFYEQTTEYDENKLTAHMLNDRIPACLCYCLCIKRL